MPDEAPWTDPVVVPDDLRELHADIEAYHRELRAARRRRRWQRVTASPAWQRWSFPGGVLLGATLVAVLVAALLASGAPRPAQPQAKLPLATSVAGVPGSAGGLLPDIPLVDAQATSGSARDLRPALIALVPLSCHCDAVLTTLSGEADEVSLPLYVVAPAAVDAEVAELPQRLHRGTVVAEWDSAGALAREFAAVGVTAVVVGRDGRVEYVARNATTATRLELPLQQAVRTA